MLRTKSLNTLALTALTVTALALPRLAATQTFYDGTFNNSDWTLSIIVENNGGTVTSMQNPNDGVPASSRYISETVNDAVIGYTAIWGLNMNTTAFYNPSSQGAITTIDYSEDSISYTNDGGSGQATGLAVLQNGKFYILRHPVIFTPDITWTHHAVTIKKADLWELRADGSYNQHSHPKFSAKGSQMQFGFYRAISTPTSGGTRNGGIDNWQVVIHH